MTMGNGRIPPVKIAEDAVIVVQSFRPAEDEANLFDAGGSTMRKHFHISLRSLFLFLFW